MNDLRWRKSSRSQQNGQCVELALMGQAVRDSKNPDGAVLVFGPTAAAGFMASIKQGRFNS